MFNFGQKQQQTSAAMMRQSVARLRSLNTQQLAILMHLRNQLISNLNESGGAVVTETADSEEEAESFDFWDDE